MKKILVENIHHTGVIPIHPVLRKLNRWLRPNYSKHLSKRKLICAVSPVDWTKPYASPIGSIKNQQQSESCGGHAGAYWLETERMIQGINEGAISAKSIYAPIAFSGGGTTVSALENQLAITGGNLESSVPSTAPDGTCTEAFMEDLSWKTVATDQDAIKRAGYTVMSVAIDIESIAEAIQNEGGVIWEIVGQNNDTWLSPYPQPPMNNQNTWNHFMRGFGYQTGVNGQQIDFTQSWGTSVGNGGIQHFLQNYINSGYIVDVFTFVADSKLVPLPNNHTQEAGYVRFFNWLFGFTLSPVSP